MLMQGIRIALISYNTPENKQLLALYFLGKLE